jgi:hypothetical protein
LNNNAGVFASPVKFIVLGADGSGLPSVAGAKNLFATSTANSTISPPTNTVLNNRIGALDNFQQALNCNSAVVSFTFSGNHNSLTDGSSLSTAPGASTSFSTLNVGVISPIGFAMVPAGEQAELFRVTSSNGTAASATVTDFFSATETSDNLGGYFTLNANTGVLDYFGAPSVVNPVPEASEWAMMLSGLCMVGLMVRRGRRGCKVKP